MFAACELFYRSRLIAHCLVRPFLRCGIVVLRLNAVAPQLREIRLARSNLLLIVRDAFTRIALRILRCLTRRNQRIELSLDRIETCLCRIDLR